MTSLTGVVHAKKNGARSAPSHLLGISSPSEIIPRLLCLGSHLSEKTLFGLVSTLSRWSFHNAPTLVAHEFDRLSSLIEAMFDPEKRKQARLGMPSDSFRPERSMYESVLNFYQVYVLGGPENLGVHLAIA